MRIDWWTLALQTVNVLVLIWILARFFFRPVADIVAKRQEEANAFLADAAAVRQKALDARADVDKVRAGIAAERERHIAEAQKTARIEQDKLLAQASQAATKLRSDAEVAIARARTVAQEAIIGRASDLAVEIAQRLLGRLPTETTLSAFLDAVCRELRTLPPEARGNFTSATVDHPIEVVTAAPLRDEEMEKVRSGLKNALGSEIPLKWRSDPILMAGIELHSRNTMVRNSWRADLDRIREELGHGKQPRGS